MSRTPPRLYSSFSSSASIDIRSLVGSSSRRPSSLSPVSSCRRSILADIVWKLVSRPPSQRWLTYGMPLASAQFLTESRACFFVPTKSTVPPLPATSTAKSRAWLSSCSVCSRSMMWIPSRSPWM